MNSVRAWVMTNQEEWLCAGLLGLAFMIPIVVIYWTIRRISPQFFEPPKVNALGWVLATITVIILANIIFKLFLFWYPELCQ